MSNYEGRFLWYELMCANVEEAESFYAKLINWDTRDWGGGEMAYRMFMVGDRAVGGLMRLPEHLQSANVPPHWMAYVGTPYLEATIQKGLAMGAELLVPATEIPEVGRWALLKDPQGAILAPFTPIEEPPEEVPAPVLGDFSWNELATPDPQASLDYYQRLFGWGLGEVMDLGSDRGPYYLFNSGIYPVGGLYIRPPHRPGTPQWLFYIKVEDLESASSQCRSLGGQVLSGPHHIPGGDLMVRCLDPQGAVFALHQAKAG